MLELIAKVLKGLNSDDNPWSIAVAIGLGIIVGLTPFWTLHNLLILIIAFLFRTHLASFWLSVVVSGMVAIGFASQLSGLGNWLLGHPDLQAMWTGLYQNEFWRMTRFNNSLLLGGFLISLFAFLPMVFINRWLVIRYRETLLERIRKLNFMKVLQASKLMSLYAKLPDRG